MECGGKRSATPLSVRAPSSSESAVVAPAFVSLWRGKPHCRRSP
jgi:hypothetical protein